MKIGVVSGFAQHTPPELIARTGQALEQRGVHSYWAPEHVVFFPEYRSAYPYSDDGKLPGDPDGVLEPFAALGFLAAHTERLRLGTGVCLVPQRHPVYTAKQVADVDYLSGGRVDFGVGIGWLREEFQALGIPWERRAARTRDALAVMKTLWCDEISQHEGEFYRLPPCLQNPKPVQKPHPPIYFGGESDAALCRVAEVGDGWFGFDRLPGDLAAPLARLDELLTRSGRSRSDVRLQVSPSLRPIDDDDLRRYRELGIDQVVMPLFAPDAEVLERKADALARLVRVAEEA